MMDVFQPFHPLLIEEVLHNVFGYLNYRKLEVCRKVCKRWARIGDNHCYKKAPVRKFEGRGIEKRVQVPREMQVDGHLEDTSRYNKFHLEQFNFGNTWNLENRQFFESHGKIITYLELGYCSFLSGKAFWGLFFCENTPCLQTLKLDRASFSFLKNKLLPDKPIKNPIVSMRTLEIMFHDRFATLPVSYNQVLETFPKLECLSLENYATDTECELGSILSNCAGYYNKRFGKCQLRSLFEGIKRFYYNNHGTGHPLSVLKLAHKRNDNYRDHFPDGMLEYFKEEITKHTSYGVKLKSLAFTADNGTDESKFYQLVDYQNTELLQRLKITVKFPTFEGGVIFLENFDLPPQLEKLTRLDLWDCRIVNFKFLLACPNLKYLTVILNLFKARESEKRNTIKATTSEWGVDEKSKFLLRSLVSFHCNFLIKWDEGDISLLCKWFPNLSSLLIHLENKTFEVICCGFKKLRQLCIYDSKVTDSAFTGINHQRSNHDDVDGATSTNIIEMQHPSIIDLKELEELAVHRFEKGHMNYDYEAAKLTEMSLDDGLLKLPKLKKLYISHFGITPSALEALPKAGFQGQIKLYVDYYKFVSDSVWYTYL